MDAYYRQREPRTADTTHAQRADPIRSKFTPTLGGRIVQIARSLIGCHYLNGAYGATPGSNDGTPLPIRRDIQLVANPKRLDPIKQVMKKENDLAVLAAQMSVKRHCVCGGNYKSFSGARPASPSDEDLNHYLASLKGQHPTAWMNYFGHYTPRRVYGPAPGGDIGGKLVWGQSCKGIRHFDCIGLISYCLWQAIDKVIQCEIAQWRTPNHPMVGSKVYDLSAKHKPDKLLDADILVKADHHIAWVDAGGTIIEAADTDLGVVANSRFDLNSPGAWTHLVRLPL